LNAPSRAPLSAVLITHNAAAQLDACLESLRFADEILVVDSGSTDATREIAARHGARIVDCEWRGFGLQKRHAVEQARHDWVFCVDADERATPELAAGIAAALAGPVTTVYRMPRRNRFLGRWLRHGEGYPDWSPRLFDRRSAQWSEDSVHEKVMYTATPGVLAGDLLHESAEDLAQYLDKQNRYTTLAAKQLYDAGRNAGFVELVFSPVVRFLKFYVFRLGMLDGVAGLVHIAIGCMNSHMKYAKLIELRRRKGRP
jgi:glycosyltransferase involved in cell wall biosynthesis